ncbi:MAG: hypothetical protein A2Y86_04095 [Candidatus Aminicenantes bacterium RBG_13_62_12]|nr:MAG: hypothetical protein A2Y86_04095 [Candidatus Aminicenantes bacterium RBG_13_62_12]
MGFDRIVGQERAKNILRLALRRGRVPNSLLFAGPEGVGKRMTAFTLARALNCLRGGDDPCEECQNCRAVLAGMEDENKGFPDVKEILPGGKEILPWVEKNNDEEAGSDVIKIRQVRYVKYHAYRRPMAGRKRAFIFNEAEKMSEPSFSAFLKVLEEPPPLTHLMMLTAYPERIPQTIASRCSLMQFGPLPREDIERHLISLGREPERARVLAYLSSGSLETALEADWKEVNQVRREAWEILRALLRREGGAEFLEDYSFLRRGKGTTERLARLWEAMAAFLRDLLLARESEDLRLLMNPDYEAALRAEASSLSPGEIQSALDRVESSLKGLRTSRNLSLLVSAFYSDIIDR